MTDEALIIAAGFGSRLAERSASKPLTPVAGVPLIELGIRQAVAAGIRRVVVVTGHAAPELETFLPDLGARCGIAIEPERLSDWSRPNGWSVLAGASRLGGDYLLLMADHLFERSILARLIEEIRPNSGLTLAVDRRLDGERIDPADATWVRTADDGCIEAIGKALTSFDAVDCGAFLATPELAVALRDAIAAGAPGSLSDGVQRLADRGRATVLDIGEAWWIDVDDPRSHALAEAQAPEHLAELYALALTGTSA